MKKGVLFAMLLFAAAAEGKGPGIPSNVPPVKLFEELNYALPELAAVKAEVDAGDIAGAKAALLAHFRARKDARRPVRDPDYDTTLADNILEGRFIWGETVCTYGPNIEDIEWYKVPEGVYWPLYDHELGRQTFVTTLVDAYRNTGDEKYAQHLIALLLEFIKDCPVEDGRGLPRINNCDGLAARTIGVEGLTKIGHPAIMWSLMVAMRRVQRWPAVVHACIHSDAVTPDALAAILTSLVEHERYIVDAVEVCEGGNHGTRTGATALEIAAQFPEFTEREVWADRATADFLNRYNWHDTNPLGFIYRDGATVEISPEVGRGDYGTLLQAMEWIRMLGREVPPQLIEIQEKMVEYLAHISWPSELEAKRARAERGEAEAFVGGANRTERARRGGGPGFFGREDLDFIETGGRYGTAPERTSYPLRSGEPCHAGTYFMRSDWTPDAVALRVRFGPIQYKYSQFGLGDVGDIGVWGYGMHLIPHIYRHPRTGPFVVYGDRSFAGDGRSENTISVDGMGQSRANRERRADVPLDNLWVTTPVFDIVRGSYRFDEEQVKATHIRAVLFVKPDYFVVIDRVDGDGGTHQYRMKYQLHQDLTAEASGTRVVGMADGGPRIVVAPARNDLDLSIVTGRKEPTYEGWHLFADQEGAPAPALIYRWEESAPARVETVICPVKPGGSADLAVSRSVADGVVTLTVTRGGCVDEIVCGEGDNVSLCRRESGKIVAAGMVGEMSVEADGLTLRPKRPGAAYVTLGPEEGAVASSNCDAEVAFEGREIETVSWDGR